MRQQVNRRSAPVLVWLSSRPKILVPLVSIVLLIAGLALPPPAGVPLLVLLLLLVGWLSYLSWPAVEGAARLVRLAVVGLLAVLVASRVAQL